MEAQIYRDVESVIFSLSKLIEQCEVIEVDLPTHFLRRESRSLLLNTSLWLSYQISDHRAHLKSIIMYQIDNIIQYIVALSITHTITNYPTKLNAEVLSTLHSLKEFVEKN